jgi:hypothetical protein
MQLQEIDTLQDLKVWVEENMAGAEVYEDMYGTLVIRTNLISTMGGYLHEREGECEKCNATYDVGSQDNQFCNCGNCGSCCTHKGEGE